MFDNSLLLKISYLENTFLTWLVIIIVVIELDSLFVPSSEAENNIFSGCL